MTKISDILNKWAGQIALIFFAIIVLWLKSLFVPIEVYNIEKEKHNDEVEVLKSEVVTLQHENTQLKNAVATGTRRLQTYIEETKDVKKEINILENEIIRLKTIEECREKWQ